MLSFLPVEIAELSINRRRPSLVVSNWRLCRKKARETLNGFFNGFFSGFLFSNERFLWYDTLDFSMGNSLYVNAWFMERVFSFCNLERAPLRCDTFVFSTNKSSF